MRSVVELIQRHEGLRLKPYKCTAGKLTIGFGRNLEDVGITVEEATQMLQHDIAECIRQLETIDGFSVLDEVRRAVLIDMTFNLGFAGILAFKNMWRAVENRDYDKAAAEMLDSKWARQVGQRALRLSTMMQTGEWP